MRLLVGVKSTLLTGCTGIWQQSVALRENSEISFASSQGKLFCPSGWHGLILLAIANNCAGVGWVCCKTEQSNKQSLQYDKVPTGATQARTGGSSGGSTSEPGAAVLTTTSDGTSCGGCAITWVGLSPCSHCGVESGLNNCAGDQYLSFWKSSAPCLRWRSVRWWDSNGSTKSHRSLPNLWSAHPLNAVGNIDPPSSCRQHCHRLQQRGERLCGENYPRGQLWSKRRKRWFLLAPSTGVKSLHTP